jgi:glycosyltransferase involved in cell wall biosynthesis
MRRFGSIFPFLEAGQRERHIGRLVANHDFVKAVLRYGDFDEFVFGNTSSRNLSVFRETADGWGLPPSRLAAIRCVTYPELPAVIASDDFEVFHLGGWGWMMAGLHYVRARYAPVHWPITAVIHSLNGREVVDHAVRLSHAGLEEQDAVVCTSRDGREALRRLLEGAGRIAGRAFDGQLIHLPLGIDDDLFEGGGDRERGRARLRIASDAVVLLVLGRITPTQKMDLAPLCRVVAQRVVPASRAPVVLLLAGAASPQDLTLAKGIVTAAGLEAHARVFPNFPLKEKADVLAMADVLVSPVDNTQETFGLSVLEAMSAGLPVVASRFDGYKDLVEDGVDGYLVDTWWSERDPMAEWFDLMDPDISQLFQSQGVAVDLDQLADRLVSLVSSPVRRAEMGRAGKARVERTFRWSRVIPQYQSAWARLREQARATAPRPPSKAGNPYAIGPNQVFSGYASHLVTRDTVVQRTGALFDQMPYNETAVLLQPALCAELLERAASPIDVGQLVETAGADATRSGYAVQWLLKYGLLRVVQPASRESL